MATADPMTVPRPKDWINISFLTLTPIIGIVGTALYTWKYGFELWMPILCVAMFTVVGLSVCAGYHRFFSHKSYECNPAVQALYAFFGAMAAQNSILCWASDHRVHHHYVDRDWDPYNIRRGFWWAHFFWIFYKAPDGTTRDNVADLKKNPVVMWQYRWNKFLVLLGVFGIPLAVGALFGRPIAGLLWGGFLRITLTHHSTFLVNSMAHSVGKPNFAAEVSARDNWVLALVTFGEGYHSFHHKFPADFRNGVRWYHWDPAKWLIWALRSLGLATKLRSTAAPMVEQARMHAAVQKLEHKLETVPTNLGDEIRARIVRAKESVEHAVALWKQHTEERASGASKSWRDTRRKCQERLRQARVEWREAVEMLAGLPEAA